MMQCYSFMVQSEQYQTAHNKKQTAVMQTKALNCLKFNSIQNETVSTEYQKNPNTSFRKKTRKP